MKQRVVVTGIGIVSSIGYGVHQFAAQLRAGANGKAPVTLFDSAGFGHDYVCEVKGFDPGRAVLNQPVDQCGRTTQFAIAATRMALRDSGLDADAIRGEEIPSIFGTTDGESQLVERLGEQLFASSYAEFDASLLDRMAAQRIALGVSRELNLTGESLTISTACAAGNYALGMGYDMVSSGETEIAVCGGSDSICRKTFAGFYRLGTMAAQDCQPFDEDRRGILTGEGSGVLLLESLGSARRRGAKIYAELVGYAVTCDADHMVAPNRESIARCMRLAHARSGIRPEEVDYICMHGTGTKSNDITEVGAVKDVFGDRSPPVSSIKSGLGHGMGAASAFGAAACCLAIRENFLPPTINLLKLDAECALDVVANHCRAATPRVVQNDAFAFGGNNAITIFRRCETQ